jgi:ferredoxin
MTTIRLELVKNPGDLLNIAIEMIRDKRRAPYVALAQLRCQFPENYNHMKVHCHGCGLYPRVCNIHKIKINHRGKLPLVWRLQTAIYNGRRKDAEKLLIKISDKGNGNTRSHYLTE